MFVLLNAVYSAHRTRSGNSRVLNKGLPNERMNEFNSYSHAVKQVFYLLPIYKQMQQRKTAEDYSLLCLTVAEAGFKPRLVCLNGGSVEQTVQTIKKMCLYVGMTYMLLVASYRIS